MKKNFLYKSKVAFMVVATIASTVIPTRVFAEEINEETSFTDEEQFSDEDFMNTEYTDYDDSQDEYFDEAQEEYMDEYFEEDQGGGSDAVSRAESWVGTAEGQAVVDLILSATRDQAITVDCCVRLQKFYIIKLDRKGNFEYLILQAYIKEVITQDEYIAAKKYYMKIK